MNTYQHPAHAMPFQELLMGLEQEVAAKTVNAKDGPNGLRMYAYSDRCVYEKAWNQFSLMARGLILDPANEKIVATPFTKFFNYGERQDQIIPDEPFEVFEKLDGSLIIIYYHAGKWNTATRGSFTSDQAKWAQAILDAGRTNELSLNCTYLAEAVYPENRIVVSYAESALVMLAGFYEDGEEMPSALVEATARWMGTPFRFSPRHHYEDIASLVAALGPLSGNEEGFVLRFASGLRLKFKGEEYRRLHKCIAGVAPLAIWEACKTSQDANVDIMAMRKAIPEEFWQDFDTILGILVKRVETIIARIEKEYAKVSELTDKELGLNLQAVSEDVRAWMFPYRKCNRNPMRPGTKLAWSIWDHIRPTGNRLEGYRASAAMNRIQSEE